MYQDMFQSIMDKKNIKEKLSRGQKLVYLLQTLANIELYIRSIYKSPNIKKVVNKITYKFP